MKTTLNPFENAKRTAQGTGGVSPSVIEEIQAEITVLGSQNTQQAQDITDIKGSLNSINDNLSGFKFYPTGTGIVGLISDDSPYKDANDKYVIWGTATANQLVEDNPNTYKAVASEEDTRGKVGADTACPFKSKLPPINPNKDTSLGYDLVLDTERHIYPLGGYSKLYLSRGSYSTQSITYSFLKKDGTYTTEVTDTFDSNWKDFDISDIIGIKMMAQNSIGLFYSLE